MAELEIRLLGGVEVQRDGKPVSLGGRRGRTLIALLALDARRTVSVERLARGLWGDDPPERVRGTVQTHVSRLRRVLGEDAVTTEPTGYALWVPRERVDVLRFRDAVARARESASGEEEGLCLDEALAVWRGEPFGEELSDWLDGFERPRLMEEYLQVVERRLELDLERGESAASALQLGVLVSEHPLRETLWVLLLRALEAGGRTAEALARYDTIRNKLASELGTDPGPELQQMHHRMLSATEPAVEVPPDSSANATVPRQLPVATAAFTGRSGELARLNELGAGGGAVVAVHGPGGSGKTSLVVHWAHREAGSFPDGELFVDLRGFGAGEAMPPATAADLLLRGLGVAGTQVPDELEARTALLRSLLADRRCLIVLDNAREAAQVRPLLVAGRSVMVVTSRRQLRSLTAHEGAISLPLAEMSQTEALGLLRARLAVGEHSHPVPEELLAELAALCGYLPVALSIVAERVGRHRDGLAVLLADLKQAANRLDVLATGEDEITDVRAVLEWTLRGLDEDAAYMFAVLGLYPDSPVNALAVSALSGLSPSQCRIRLDRLADFHLVDALPDGWYAVHDLVSAFAGEVAERELLAADRDKAMTRLRSWFLHSAENARYVLRGFPSRFRFPAPEPGIELQAFSASAQARQWFSRHHTALTTLITDAEHDEDHYIASALLGMLASSLPSTGRTAEARMFNVRALQCAERSGDVHLVGGMANSVSVQVMADENYDRAQVLIERAQSCFAECADWASWAAVTSNAAHCLMKTGRPQEAVAQMEEVCRKSRVVDLPLVERGFLLSRLASFRNRTGDPERGLAEAEQAIEMLTEAGAGLKVGLAHVIAASALVRLHRWPEAEHELKTGVAEYEAHGAKDLVIDAWIEFARLQREHGEPEAAQVTLKQAVEEVDRFEASGDFDGTSMRMLAQGRLKDLRIGSTARWPPT